MIPYGRQEITERDINSVVEILSSDFLTQGPVIPKFEHAVKGYCGASYALAVNSATSALHIACLALGLKEGDLLWTSPNTFVASANCALYCGAEVDFVDICPSTYNLSVEQLEEKLERASAMGRLPKILVTVHFAGQSCQMNEVRAIADSYGVKIIEDASHAIGGSFLSSKVGSCDYSDVTIFSFHPVKIITTGEGGMLLTNSKDVADRAELYRTHGITRQIDRLESNDGPWFYEQHCLGFNYRLTDIQGALGLSQLERLDEIVTRRHEIAGIYNQELADLPLTLPHQNPSQYSAYHLFVILVDPERRLQIFEKLREQDIGVNVHYIPVHTQPYFANLGFLREDFPEAMKYYRSTISIPMFPTLTEGDQGRVIEALVRELK